MGQMVAVTEKPSSNPGAVRFELNRALTGMGHEYFTSAADAFGPRPAAELARRLFATGEVDAVHVYANIVTVELARGGSPEPLADIVRTLYRYWQPGMHPPAFEDLVVEEEAAPAASSGGGADAALSAAAQRVPAHLLERSRAGRERWKSRV
jgi:hypothetical protein